MDWSRSDIVTASFAAGGPGAAFDPIRAQNLLFLIDREVSDRIGGPFFDFRPYHYGPFDRAVYGVIGELVAAGTAHVDTSGSCSHYLLTTTGYRRGAEVLADFSDPVADYMKRASRWVRLMPYRRMLAAIRRQYPDMAVSSVIRRRVSKRSAPRENPFVRGMSRAFDVTGTMHRGTDTAVDRESDGEAIRDAWDAVGRALEDAMVGFGESERLW